MAQVLFHYADGNTTQVKIRDGQTILRAAKQGRVSLRHKCGGQASCTTCKVRIDDQFGVSEPEKKERMKLGEEQLKNNMRLSCQTKVYRSADAHIPEDPYKARIRALLEAERNQ